MVLRGGVRKIDWHGRDGRLVPVAHEDSSYFSALAEQLRDAQGRILPTLVRRYAGVELSQVDQVALTAYSAGHGLLNKVGAVPADARRLSAMLLHDATFAGFNDPPKAGYVAMGRRAIDGDGLMVSTTSTASGPGYLSGRDSWMRVWSELMRETGKQPYEVKPGGGLVAAGSWWQLGSRLTWCDSNLSHVGNHDAAAVVWQQFLAPWFSRWRWIEPALVGAVVSSLALGARYWWHRRRRMVS